MSAEGIQAWLDRMAGKQRRVSELKRALSDLEAELRKDAQAVEVAMSRARSILGVSAPSGAKPKSRHGFTHGVRMKPIQDKSSVWWTQMVLAEAGGPLHIDQILARIFAVGGGQVKKSTLISNLSRYIKHHDTFTRTAPSTYGLLSYPPVMEVSEWGRSE